MYDVAIIGGGVIGSSIARELSKYKLKICVLEKELDVCCETSGRNSGVLHAGFNNRPGSLMAKFCVEGNKNFDQVAKDLDIPFERSGKLVVGFTKEDKEKLIKFCKGVQYASPIDSFVECEPWAMPGYSDEVIMAAGAFIQGSSIELSADAPIREPYIAYLQGGLTFDHAKIGVLIALNNIFK